MTTQSDSFDKRLFLLPSPKGRQPTSYRLLHNLAIELLSALREAEAKLKEPGK